MNSFSSFSAFLAVTVGSYNVFKVTQLCSLTKKQTSHQVFLHMVVFIRYVSLFSVTLSLSLTLTHTDTNTQAAKDEFQLNGGRISLWGRLNWK